MVRDEHPYMAEGRVNWELLPGTALMKHRVPLDMDWVVCFSKTFSRDILPPTRAQFISLSKLQDNWAPCVQVIEPLGDTFFQVISWE